MSRGAEFGTFTSGWKRTGVWLLLSAAQLFASCAAFAVSFGLSMERFDHGGDPGRLEQLCNGCLMVLSFPLTLVASLSPIRLPVLLQFGMVFANSLIWGWCGTFLILGRNPQRRVEREADEGGPQARPDSETE